MATYQFFGIIIDCIEGAGALWIAMIKPKFSHAFLCPVTAIIDDRLEAQLVDGENDILVLCTFDCITQKLSELKRYDGSLN